MTAAVAATWGCRLSYARLVTPVDPPAIQQFDPAGGADQAWAFDWYSHVLFASQLFEAVRALVPIIGDAALEDALAEYSAHWAQLRGVRNVLLHPIGRDVNVGWLCAFGDRVEYREPGCDARWVLDREDLHTPVERLFAVVQQYR
jgi:hypothetical protein